MSVLLTTVLCYRSTTVASLLWPLQDLAEARITIRHDLSTRVTELEDAAVQKDEELVKRDDSLAESGRRLALTIEVSWQGEPESAQRQAQGG